MKSAIEVRNVSKRFELNRKNESFLGKIISGEKNKRFIQALKDVSFKGYEKEKIGLIGSNGSGKSTLLKIIAGIYQQDKGEIKFANEPVYLGGFNYGIKPKLTMKENIFLIGSILGLDQRTIKGSFNNIIEFSDLKKFIDVKVEKFSTGMLARLNFSIRINYIEAHAEEILLLDEVFSSGGDEAFKEKIKQKVNDIMKLGSTIIIASHDLDFINEYCQKVIWIEDGMIRKIGKPKAVTKEYILFSKKLRCL